MNLYAASQPASSQTSTDCDGVDVTLDPSAAPLMRLHSRAHSAGLNGCDGGPMSWPEFRLRGLISIGGRGETWAMGEALRGIIRRPRVLTIRAPGRSSCYRNWSQFRYARQHT